MSSASPFTWRRAASILVTLLAVAAALWAALRLWDRYELQPWTRDGRVRANVVQIAPDVSGLVTAVPVQDNQQVAAGALLFEVDRARYELTLRQAQAQLSAQKVALAQALREADRNSGLGSLVSQEAREQTCSRADQARAAVAQAEVAVDSARLNLARAEIRAPSSGTITNFDLRQGAYATAGHPVLALVDAQSLYVEGYFEETKLPRIHVGDPVEIQPMGASHALRGHVESFSAGIADRDRSTSANLLPSVNPSFNWVRLPQRVPVRVKLDPLPPGERLVAGQTVTVQVLPASTTATAQTTATAAPAKTQAEAPVASAPRHAQQTPSAKRG
ncbi:efflux transporter periplasmic adaptor subunit [Roseateles aquatilis]|uniref:Efflux transporter periplasmic adaptor subunit n=2 Tax=Roseateles aquatilis TaxID=431061 RepID=A0A246JNA5_9BURK|nr:HlyD family secretion protein [Roseateles aquatilis]OWQ93983.1 efflux transporter periplasmic adaptor subunit [Roseateles aquatilis]